MVLGGVCFFPDAVPDSASCAFDCKWIVSYYPSSPVLVLLYSDGIATRWPLAILKYKQNDMVLQARMVEYKIKAGERAKRDRRRRDHPKGLVSKPAGERSEVAGAVITRRG